MKVFGEKIIDWKNIDSIPPEQRKAKILEAVSDFMKRVGKKAVSGVKLSGAEPSFIGTPPVVSTYSDVLHSPDRGYEVLFEEVNMRQATSPTFEILDISGGVTFYQQKPGERAKLSVLPAGEKANVDMLRFTGGFPILDDWLRFNQYYKIDELTRDTVTKWYNQKADLFYGLLIALSASINQAFVTDDITTINNACGNILLDLENAGYAVDQNTGLYITCNTLLKPRIMKALASHFMAPNTNNTQIVWNIAGVITTSKIPNTSYYVSVPGIKSKRGEWEDLNARPPQRNELVLGADHVWTGAYNAAIGEVKQYKRCALS